MGFVLPQIENSWKRTLQKKLRLVEPLVENLGLFGFLDIFIEALISSMTLNREIADKYLVPLDPLDIEIIITEPDKEEVKAVYDDYIEKREEALDPPNPFELYKFAFEKSAHGMFFYHKSNSYLSETVKKEILKLQDTKRLKSFLDEPIPGLTNLTVSNVFGVNYNCRSLISWTSYPRHERERQYDHGLSILETGEDTTVRYESKEITLYDVLVLVMSVKSSKENFIHEYVNGVSTLKEDESSQVLTLSISNR